MLEYGIASIVLIVLLVGFYLLGYTTSTRVARRKFLAQGTREYFLDWQQATMVYTVLANTHLCDDGWGPSITADRIEGIAAQIRNDAHGEESLWSHAVTCRAVDATIGWCARWLGMVNQGTDHADLITAAAYAEAEREIRD